MTRKSHLLSAIRVRLAFFSLSLISNLEKTIEAKEAERSWQRGDAPPREGESVIQKQFAVASLFFNDSFLLRRFLHQPLFRMKTTIGGNFSPLLLEIWLYSRARLCNYIV